MAIDSAVKRLAAVVAAAGVELWPPRPDAEIEMMDRGTLLGFYGFTVPTITWIDFDGRPDATGLVEATTDVTGVFEGV